MTAMVDHSDRLVPFPEDDADRYLAAGIWERQPLGVAFADVAARYPDRTALVCGDDRLTYAELDVASDQRAAGLHALGLPVGGPVLLQIANSAETVVTWYALIKAGLVPVCTLSLHRSHEISEIARQVEPVAHVVDADGGSFDLVSFALEESGRAARPWPVLVQGSDVRAEVGGIAGLGADIAPDDARDVVRGIAVGMQPIDVAVFQLSGGTTGVPKVIPRLHAEYWYNAAAYAAVLGWTAEDRVAYIGPVVHNAGIICGVHGPHSVGAAAVLGVPKLDGLFDLLADEQATDIVLGPFAYDAALDPRLERATALRRVLFSGKKVSPQHFGSLADRGIWAGQLFGMGEGLCMITPLDAPSAVRANSVGVPISAFDEVRLLAPGTEDDVVPGDVGELCVRGPYTLRGYYSAPEHNARAFTSDGFYRTGDLAAARVIDGVPCYAIEGRIKDLINRGGEKINAEEVELLLVQHPDIVESALVAMPDERLGERACAYVVGRDGVRLDIADITAFLKSMGVASYKWPEQVVWLEEMPRASQVGKIDKKSLRRDAAGRRPAPR